MFDSLPAHYSGTHWTLLRGYMLLNALRTHSLAENPKDGAWLLSTLDLLACCIYISQDTLGSGFLNGENSAEWLPSSSASEHTSTVDVLLMDLLALPLSQKGNPSYP